MSVPVSDAGASTTGASRRGVADASSADIAAARAAWALLAPAIAGRPRVRVSRDQGRTYPARVERALDDRLPDQPAAVLLFDAAGEARCLAADFDVARGGRAQVDADAAAFAELVATCGGRTVADVSPTGGRHVYVFWSAPVPIGELRPLMRGLGARFPSLDATPMLNASAGCIRPPGAAHRSGGHQVLTTPLPAAQAAVAAPCGPEVWSALHDALGPAPDPPPAPAGLEPAPAGPRRALSARIERIARTGVYDTERYATPSEARQAVVTAAAAAGWTLAEVATRLETSAWRGLAGLYGRYRRGVRGALARDFRKAHSFLARKKNGPESTTRDLLHSGSLPANLNESDFQIGPVTEDVYGWLRSWLTGMRALEKLRYRGRGTARRRLWRAIGQMAQRVGSAVLAVGRRSLAIAAGLDDTTVSELLREFREEDDPWIVLLENDRGLEADLYQLRIPDAVVETARWRSWRAGLIEAPHPIFRILGGPAGLAYEVLSSEPLPRREVAREADLPDTTLDRALSDLAVHGLAERVPYEGWRRGPADRDTLADTLGATDLVQAQINAYAAERAAFRALHGLPATRPAPTAYAGPAAPVSWPDQVDAPAPAGPDDDAYDRALAHIGAAVDEYERHEAALALLRAGLAATELSDRVEWAGPLCRARAQVRPWP